MHKGQWIKSAAGCYEVRGKTLGIIGYGHIGSQVSILAESFGMKVIFHDTTTQLPMGNATQVEDLDELLENADAITLHVPEDQGTQNLVDETFLSKMKQGSVIINASRGTVVDIEALEKSLKSNHVRGAAIDVFPIEPAKNGMPFSSPLQGIPNVILSPHIGGSTSEAQKNISLEVCQKLIQYSDIGSSMGSVNFPNINLPIQSNSHRLLHVHQNNPGILGAINQVLAESKTNIMGQYLQTFDDIGYVVIDVNQAHDTNLRKKLLEIPGTIRCRILY
jgi:D-3-phosphoglycerate dehydrogenase